MKRLLCLMLMLGCAHSPPPVLDVRILDVRVARELPRDEPVVPHMGVYKASFNYPSNLPKTLLGQPQTPAYQGRDVTFLTGTFTTVVATGVSVGTSGLQSTGTNTLSGGTPLNLTAPTGGMYCNNAAARCIIETAVTAGNAGATAATAGVQLFTDNALDGTDYVFSIGNAVNAASIFSVQYDGTVNVPTAVLKLGTSGASVTASGASTILNAGGYQNVFNAGTGAFSLPTNSNSGTFSVGGYLNINATAVGNVGASAPDDLMTYTLVANAITQSAHGVRITAWGICANNAAAKTFTLNFGSQVVLTHACTASVANERWVIRSRIIRTGTSTQDWVSEYTGTTGTAGAFEYDPEIGTATQTETATIVIKMQTTASTSDNDIVQEGMFIEYL